jgi:cytochrome c553
MAEVAQSLRPDDIAAVTAWLAEQPLPQPYRPEATLPQPAPLRCGSVVVEAPTRSPAAQGARR